MSKGKKKERKQQAANLAIALLILEIIHKALESINEIISIIENLTG